MKSNDAVVLIGLGDCLTNRGSQRVQEANGTSEEAKNPPASGTSEDAKKPPASGTLSHSQSDIFRDLRSPSTTDRAETSREDYTFFKEEQSDSEISFVQTRKIWVRPCVGWHHRHTIQHFEILWTVGSLFMDIVHCLSCSMRMIHFPIRKRERTHIIIRMA